MQRGAHVLVPFREGARHGIVTRVRHEDPDPARTWRFVLDVFGTEPLVRETQLRLAEWIADYYHAPIGEAVRLLVPPGWDAAASRSLRRDPDDDRLGPELAALFGDEPVLDADELRRRRPGTRWADIARWEAEGRLQSEYNSDASRLRPKTFTRLHLAEGAGLADANGERQQRIVGFLGEFGPAAWDELRELFSLERAHLRPLVQRGVVRTEEVEVARDPFAQTRIVPRDGDPELSVEQAQALDVIRSAVETQRTVLLHGVTGSGKTEVYVRAIRDARARGGRSLVLLPEIALTPQLVSVFRAALGDGIAVLHSELTPGERFDQWRRIRQGTVDVVIGARSALFAPIGDPALLIVDEEHDPSFKQDDGVRYNARDAAVVLARLAACACVLGSATPSLESLANARRGRYLLARMPSRVGGRPLPRFELIDMRLKPPDPADPVSRFLSPELQFAVRDTVDAGEQAILFLNRRGFAPSVECLDCGQTLVCAACAIDMTYHRRGHVVRCHYCGASEPVPSACPTCGSPQLEPQGYGTEQIEARVAEAFQNLRVGRLDRDSARGRGLARILDDFRARRTDVLIGTQMVTKGHDFPGVTLVGVINADQSLRFPDFRSGERTFQLLAQVAGRAGRGEQPGRVLVQTMAPDHYVIRAGAASDYDAFAERELDYRQRLDYPPWGHLALLRFDSPDEDALRVAAEALVRWLTRHADPSVRLLGPVPAPIARVRDRSRLHASFRSPERAHVHHLARATLAWIDHHLPKLRREDIRVSVDIDPLHML